MIKRLLFALVLLLPVIFISCEEDFDVAPSLVTEDILYLSGERIRLSGRVITTSEINASDHGFYISQDQNFSNPIIISLGNRERPGRFIGETTGLQVGQGYFVKSFLSLQEEILFGNILEIETLQPRILDFSPKGGFTGSIVEIVGLNLTEDTRVFFGEQEGEVISNDFESNLRVRVPAITTDSRVTVRVVSQNVENLFETQFEYVVGKYSRVNVVHPTIRILEGVSFQEGNTFYVGFGTDNNAAMNNSMWRYTVGDANWEAIDPGQTPLRRAFFSENFYGGGSSSFLPIVPGNDFVKLENGNFVKLNDLPFQILNASSFEIGNSLYVVGGDTREDNTFYTYSMGSNSWSVLPNAPYNIRINTTNFTYNNKQYFILPESKKFVSYTPATDTWTEEGVFPGEIGPGGAIGVVIGERAYVGMGVRSNEMWEYNFSTSEWLRKNDFIGRAQGTNAGVYTHNGLIYIVRVSETLFPDPMELWIFDPFDF